MSQFLGDRLIFLISQPRAGSTLLQRMLNGHPEIVSSAEPWIMLPIVYGRRADGMTADYRHDWAQLGTQQFADNYADGNATLDEAARQYAHTLYCAALHSGERYFLDKTPRYYNIIPDLRRLFPQAHFILLLRNPLAVLGSMLANWFPLGYWHHMARFKRDLLDAPTLLAEAISAEAPNTTVVHYEKLVASPTEIVSSLCEVIDLPFVEPMVTYGANDAPEGMLGDAHGVHTQQTATTDSLDKWLKQAERQQTRHFLQQYLARLEPAVLDTLGYAHNELAQQLARVPLDRRETIVPFDLVIRPNAEWRTRERWQYERALAHQKHGPKQGNRRFLKQQLGRLRSGQLTPTWHNGDPHFDS